MNYQKCVCESCGQHIEFPVEGCGQTIDCPCCHKPLLLPQAENQKRTGILQGLLDKYRAAKQKSLRKRELKASLLAAVSDGLLENSEMESLSEQMTEFGLSLYDLKKWGREIFLTAFNAASKRQHLSTQAYSNLTQIQGYLGLPDEEVHEIKAQMHRSRFLFDIQNGKIPPISVPNLILRKGENAYWSEPGTIYEESVVNRHYEGGSVGTSIRIMKGVSFRVGQHRGRLISQTGHVPVSTGILYITNERLVFQGDAKSFATDLNKIFEVQPAMDGLRFSETGKEKSRIIVYHSPDAGDLVCEVLSVFLEKARQ